MKRAIVCAAVFALVSMVFAPRVFAQGFGGPAYASVTSSVSPASLKPGATGKLLIRIAVKPGYHIQSAKPSDPDLIATSFAPSSTPAIHFMAAKYPKDVMMTMAGESKPSPVYTGMVLVAVPFSVSKSAKPGALKIGGALTYQGCNATACYPPKNESIRASISVK